MAGASFGSVVVDQRRRRTLRMHRKRSNYVLVRTGRQHRTLRNVVVGRRTTRRRLHDDVATRWRLELKAGLTLGIIGALLAAAR